MTEDRALLLWQVRWLVYFYMCSRMYWSVADPLFTAYEKALETGEWEEYRVLYTAAKA